MKGSSLCSYLQLCLHLWYRYVAPGRLPRPGGKWASTNQHMQTKAKGWNCASVKFIHLYTTSSTHQCLGRVQLKKWQSSRRELAQSGVRLKHTTTYHSLIFFAKKKKKKCDHNSASRIEKDFEPHVGQRIPTVQDVGIDDFMVPSNSTDLWFYDYVLLFAVLINPVFFPVLRMNECILSPRQHLQI